jgi:tripartite-type tricarboxylate transporter receptor subunit TctC
LKKFNTMRRAVLVAAIALTSWTVQAQGTYPDKPITLIVPYTAGRTDRRRGAHHGAAPRRAARPGRGGAEHPGRRRQSSAPETASRARPDGYTLYFGVNSMAIFPHVRPATVHSPSVRTTSLPIGGVAESAHVVLASKSAGFRTVPEMIAAAKKAPDSVSYGSAGIGGTTHLPLALFAHRAGIKLLHVPYKGRCAGDAGHHGRPSLRCPRPATRPRSTKR